MVKPSESAKTLESADLLPLDLWKTQIEAGLFTRPSLLNATTLLIKGGKGL